MQIELTFCFDRQITHMKLIFNITVYKEIIEFLKTKIYQKQALVIST